MSSPSDFPEKVWLRHHKVRLPSERPSLLLDGDPLLAAHLADEDYARKYQEVQPYFSASLVAELVEAMKPFAELADEVDRHRHADDSTCLHRLRASHLRRARAAVSKAQSSLGVKG